MSALNFYGSWQTLSSLEPCHWSNIILWILILTTQFIVFAVMIMMKMHVWRQDHFRLNDIYRAISFGQIAFSKKQIIPLNCFFLQKGCNTPMLYFPQGHFEQNSEVFVAWWAQDMFSFLCSCMTSMKVLQPTAVRASLDYEWLWLYMKACNTRYFENSCEGFK